MNEDEDIFVFPESKNQLELDFGASMDDTITIRLEDLMTTSTTASQITTGITMASGSLLTAGATGPTWTLPTSLNNGYTIAASLPTAVNSTYTYDSITLGNGAWDNTNSKGLTVKGDADFEGDIKIKGVNLTDRLDEIEKRLAILRPNNDLEGKWEKLKALGEEYRKMEKEILEGESIWDILKK